MIIRLDPNVKRKPPGPPPGPPPPLAEFEGDDDDKQLGMIAEENLRAGLGLYHISYSNVLILKKLLEF